MIAQSATDTVDRAEQRAESVAGADEAMTTGRADAERLRAQPPRVAREMRQLNLPDQTIDSVASSVLAVVEKTAKAPTAPRGADGSEAATSNDSTRPETPDRRRDEQSHSAQGPLRADVVAQRATATRAEAPTVVEITIDRIDVRVPKTGNVTQARPAAKRAEPTQSLSDYLRERQKGGA